MSIFKRGPRPPRNAVLVGSPRDRNAYYRIMLGEWRGPALIIRSHAIARPLLRDCIDYPGPRETCVLGNVPTTPVAAETLLIVTAAKNMLTDRGKIPPVVIDALERSDVSAIIGCSTEPAVRAFRRWNVTRVLT